MKCWLVNNTHQHYLTSKFPGTVTGSHFPTHELFDKYCLANRLVSVVNNVNTSSVKKLNKI